MWASCGLKLTIHAVCHEGSFCTCWAAACFTRRQCSWLDDQIIFHQFLAVEKFSRIFKLSRQLMRPTQPPVVPYVLWEKRLGQEANTKVCLILGLRMCGAVCVLYLHTLLYPHCVVVMKHGERFTWHVAHSTNCCVRYRWITIQDNVLFHR